MICLTPSAISLWVSCAHGQPALGVLRAGHRDGGVVEHLVGDVHAGGDARLHGELAGVEERAVADVLEDVLDVGERRLPDPLRALAAHLGQPGDGAVRAAGHRDHGVAADAAAGHRALGHRGGAVVRAAGAEVRGRVAGSTSATAPVAAAQLDRSSSTRRSGPAGARGQLAVGGDQRSPVRVLLAEIRGASGRAVEDVLDLGLDERGLVLDDEDLLEAVGEPRTLSGPSG